VRAWPGVGDPSRRVVIWLIPIFLTLHNAEEAITFRRYAPGAVALLPAPLASHAMTLRYSAFVQLLAGLALLAFVIALMAERWPHSRRLLWLLLALQATIGLNVLAHVVTAAVLFRGYGPGLVTAVLVNAPFTVHCFRRAAREHWVSPAAMRATVPAAFLLHGPVLLGALWLTGVLGR